HNQMTNCEGRKLGVQLGGLVIAALVVSCSQPAPPAPTWKVVANISVGQTPGPVTLGGGWAFVPNMSDGTVTQVDRKTGKIVATIKVADPHVLRAKGCAPDSVHAYYSGSWGWRLCDTPYAIAWGASHLWAIDNGRPQLVEIDPLTHERVDDFTLPGTGWDVVVAGTKAFVSGYEADQSFYMVDIPSHQVTTVSDLDEGAATMAVDSSGVWIACARARVGHLDLVDPVTGHVTHRYAMEGWSTDVAGYGGGVYVRGSMGGDVSRVNGATGAMEWTHDGPGFIGRQGIDELGVGPDGVWISGPTTVRMNAQTGTVAEKVGIASTSAAADANELWLVQVDGVVSELVWK
ncbi:MAG: hypothetical protein ABI959_12970, partial [Candidatus Dormiibacterota bacterium]